jgi:molybdate transport system substrate-binding protein
MPHHLLCAVLAWLCATAHAGEVRVAVAANFAVPMARIAQAFVAATGHTAALSSGSTGKFHAQIVNGAPFDVLLAADERTPQALIDSGHAQAASRFTYAVGRLVLWSAKPGLVDAQGAVLASGRFAHLALANPKVAPYGAAAMQALRSRGLDEKLAPKLVLGESIAQAYQFVASGNAEMGFVALSLVQQPGRPVAGSAWLVPEALHAPIRQDAVLLKPGENNAAARALLEFMKSPAALDIVRAHGYRT